MLLLDLQRLYVFWTASVMTGSNQLNPVDRTNGSENGSVIRPWECSCCFRQNPISLV